jgi:tetratricopeptide (TPR) repeat protein
MLKSKFAKNKEKFQAQKIFTDRKKPSNVFKESILNLDERKQELIVFYGKGGIGKSRLIKKLLSDSEQVYEKYDKKRIHNIFVSLDAYEFFNPVNILMSIRSQVYGDCGFFDYALLQYCAKAKMTVDEIKNKSFILPSSIVEVLNEVIDLGTGSACVPTALLQKSISFIKDHLFRKKYQEEIEQISMLNEFEIYERLPYYLGLCISNAIQSGDMHVIFLDSYESMLARTAGVTPSVGNEEWLQELFLSCETIRIIIASRDRLKWDRMDEEWGLLLNQHRLDNLSKEDSRWFLEQVPIKEEDQIKIIVEKSGGVPLYLDMCVDIYEADKNKGKTSDFNSIQNGEKIIDRYMRHLNQKDKFAVKVLSVPGSFSIKYAINILEKQNLIYSEDEIVLLFDKSIILPLDDRKGTWKVDESVRLHLREQMDPSHIKNILKQMIECIKIEKSGRGFPYLASILEMITDNPVYLEGIEEVLVEQVEYYASAGFWDELHKILKGYTESKNESLNAIAVVEELIYLRRCGNLKEAEEFGACHTIKKEILGVWYYMYRYLLIQIRHLEGYYEECMNNYKVLLDDMELIRLAIPQHVYITVAMKYADLLFLQGKFEKSLETIKNLQNNNGISLVDKIELMRIEGHIYRFCDQFENAELIYRQALKMIKDNHLCAYEGKLYNNMTEALCMIRPTEAMEWYKKSEQLNSQTENWVELGKTYAAGALAQAKMGNGEEAFILSQKAIVEAEKTGYKSGRAFGLYAECVANKTLGNMEACQKSYQNLKQQLEEIKVYRYILEKVEKI